MTGTMQTLFFGRKNLQKLERAERLEQAAISAHRNSLSAIEHAGRKGDTLKSVLEANHITIQIHKAVNKNVPQSNIRPTY